MLSHIYPTGLQLSKVNSFITEAPFLDLDLSITNAYVDISTIDFIDNKIYI